MYNPIAVGRSHEIDVDRIPGYLLVLLLVLLWRWSPVFTSTHLCVALTRLLFQQISQRRLLQRIKLVLENQLVVEDVTGSVGTC